MAMLVVSDPSPAAVVWDNNEGVEAAIVYNEPYVPLVGQKGSSAKPKGKSGRKGRKEQREIHRRIKGLLWSTKMKSEESIVLECQHLLKMHSLLRRCCIMTK
jgi:hypothetical protein